MSATAKQVSRPAKLDLVSISLCCNNPDNGMFVEQIYRIEIGRDILTLESNNFPASGPRLNYDFKNDGAYGSVRGFGADPVTGRIKVSRRWFPVWGYKYGWGNWCWDLVLMTTDTTIDLLNYLKELKAFQIDSGETRWCNYFEAEDAVFDKSPTGWIRMLEKWGYQKP